MNPKASIVERAFQLAGSGQYDNTNAITKALIDEGYAGVDLMDITPALAMQIRSACSEAQAVR